MLQEVAADWRCWKDLMRVLVYDQLTQISCSHAEAKYLQYNVKMLLVVSTNLGFETFQQP